MASKRRLRRETERLKEHVCGYKQRYTNQTSAVASAINLSRKRGIRYDIYKCKFCKCWHVGHKHRKELLNVIAAQREMHSDD